MSVFRAAAGPCRNSGEDKKDTNQHFLRLNPFEVPWKKCTKRTTGHYEPLSSVTFQSNLFHDGFKDRAALVTLCFRPEVLALKKSKKEKSERKKFP